MLRSANNPNPDWVALAPQFDGSSGCPPCAMWICGRTQLWKAYMHNGYLKSLKGSGSLLQHRISSLIARTGSPGEKVTCCCSPEVLANIDHEVGNLGLTDEQENENCRVHAHAH